MKKLLFLLLLFTLGIPRLSAQPGTLDPGFNGTGTVTTTFIAGQDDSRAIVIQPDGKIIVAGKTYTTGTAYTSDFALCRYNPDGSLDSTFGAAGKTITDFYGFDEEANAVIIRPDGKILAAGFSYDSINASLDFAVARYSNNGILDLSFGNNGKVLTFFDGDAFATSIVIQADGKVVVAGKARYLLGNPDFGLARYSADGVPDSTFGINGIVRTDFNAGSEDNAFAMVLQPDGKLVVAGETRPDASVNIDFAMARYNSNGALDSTFGIAGKVVTDFGTIRDEAFAMAIQPDGKLLLTGKTGTDFTADFAIARYTTAGIPDNTFGTGGKVIRSGKGVTRAIVIQPDSSIVVAGTGNDMSGISFGLFRYRYNGAIDSSFGIAGEVHTSILGSDEGHALALQPDGKIVLTGTGNNTFVTARYHSSVHTAGINDPESNATLLQLFPNPANGTATLAYELKTDERISIDLCDMQGRIIKTILSNELRNTGTHTETITLQNIPAGIYFVILSSDQHRSVWKIVVGR